MAGETLHKTTLINFPTFWTALSYHTCTSTWFPHKATHLRLSKEQNGSGLDMAIIRELSEKMVLQYRISQYPCLKIGDATQE